MKDNNGSQALCQNMDETSDWRYKQMTSQEIGLDTDSVKVTILLIIFPNAIVPRFSLATTSPDFM